MPPTAKASSAASDRLRQLTEADIQKLSKCNGGNGSCTNGAAALSALLARSAESAACAAALAAMCGEPGEGGIGKGYASDLVKHILTDNGVRRATAALGGNVMVMGGKGRNTPWTVGIQDPADTAGYAALVDLYDGFVVTSGGYQRYFVAEDGTEQRKGGNDKRHADGLVQTFEGIPLVLLLFLMIRVVIWAAKYMFSLF